MRGHGALGGQPGIRVRAEREVLEVHLDVLGVLLDHLSHQRLGVLAMRALVVHEFDHRDAARCVALDRRYGHVDARGARSAETLLQLFANFGVRKSGIDQMRDVANGVERCPAGAVVFDRIDEAMALAAGRGLAVHHAEKNLALEIIELAEIDAGWRRSVVARRRARRFCRRIRAGGWGRGGLGRLGPRKDPRASAGRDERRRRDEPSSCS